MGFSGPSAQSSGALRIWPSDPRKQIDLIADTTGRCWDRPSPRNLFRDLTTIMSFLELLTLAMLDGVEIQKIAEAGASTLTVFEW